MRGKERMVILTEGSGNAIFFPVICVSPSLLVNYYKVTITPIVSKMPLLLVVTRPVRDVTEWLTRREYSMAQSSVANVHL